MKSKSNAISLCDVKICDSFWTKHIQLVKDVILPYQWDAMNDQVEGAEPSHCIENFRIAAGEAEGKFYGAAFQDSDVAKWLEAVAYTLATNYDEELSKTADEVIALIGRAQCEDGYLNTYWTLQEPGRRWSNLVEGHELYTAGHTIEAAVAYYEVTGKRNFLDIVIKYADLICEVFGTEEGKNHGYPGHQEIELALLRLHTVTGDEKYRDLAKYFIDQRGVGENYFLKEMALPDFKKIFPELSQYLPLYSQSHMPVREQKTAEGHAVRAVYMYSAMADLAYAYKDESLLDACKTLWDNMTTKRMYVTGSIGSSGLLERFTTDYDLPNDANYSESCASIGLALFGLRMARITGEAKYIDVVENALYNTVLGGIALDGKSFFYVNPLEVQPENCLPRTSKEHVKPIRQKWFGCACCPPNIARTLASLGQYIYSVSEDTIYVNMFVSNEAKVCVGGHDVDVKLETKFPAVNAYTLCIRGGATKLGLRIPAYAENFQVTMNGNLVTYTNVLGFAEVEAEENCKVEVTFEAPARLIHAHPMVSEDTGKVCIMKGPIVYALEEVDNGKNLASIYIKPDETLHETYDEALFNGVVTISAKAKKIASVNWQEGELYKATQTKLEDITIKAIPYCYWNNRGVGEMLVWIKEKI